MTSKNQQIYYAPVGISTCSYKFCGNSLLASAISCSKAREISVRLSFTSADRTRKYHTRDFGGNKKVIVVLSPCLGAIFVGTPAIGRVRGFSPLAAPRAQRSVQRGG